MEEAAIQTIIQVEQAEVNAFVLQHFLYFRRTTVSNVASKKATVDFFFQASGPSGPADICLYECSGPYFLAHWTAKSNSRPYQYLREREWLPVKFSRPGLGSTWEYQSSPVAYFGARHAQPRSREHLRTARHAYQAARQTASQVQRTPVASPQQRVNFNAATPRASPVTTRLGLARTLHTAQTTTSTQPPSGVEEAAATTTTTTTTIEEAAEAESASSATSTDSRDGVEEAILESEAEERRLNTMATANNLDPELLVQFQAFLAFQQQTRGQIDGASANTRAQATNVPTVVPDPFDVHTARPAAAAIFNRDPRIQEAGRLLSRIDQLTEAITWREEALAANFDSFPLRVGYLQSPSGDRFSPELADHLNNAISECSRRCSELVLREQHRVLERLHEEKDALADGWVRTNTERLAIQEVRARTTRQFVRRAIPTNPIVGPTPYFLPPSEHQNTIHPNADIVRAQSTGLRRSRSRSQGGGRNRSESRNRGRDVSRNRLADHRDDRGHNNNHHYQGNGNSVRFQRRGGRS